MKKYKRLYKRKMKTTQFLEKIAKERPKLFAHWQVGMRGAFAWWERYESRGSRTVLRAASGEVPLVYSLTFRTLAPSRQFLIELLFLLLNAQAHHSLYLHATQFQPADYRALICERTEAGLKAARARGRMGGRPPQLDSRQINRMIEMYNEQKNTVAEICKIYDISRPSFYNYLKRTKKLIPG